MPSGPAISSIDSPLRIATLPLMPAGRLGLTICPGKHAPTSLGGHPWARDLTIDLEAIRAWGADAVVTLMEQWELEQYGVHGLGEAVAMHGMRWFHLPIVDGEAPLASWDEAWSATHYAAIQQILDAGGSIVIHCLGGRGRTGTVAARLLIQRGSDPQSAIHMVRAAREGAIETEAQERYLWQVRPFA